MNIENSASVFAASSDITASGLQHPPVPVEWWFLQGRYGAADSQDNCFMFAFFRYNIAKQDESPKYGYGLLFAELALGSAIHSYKSWTDPVIWDNVVENLRNNNRFMDDLFRKALLEEFEQGKPPLPIELKTEPVVFRYGPLHAEWDGFCLRECLNGEMEFYFTLPSSGKTLAFLLKPVNRLHDIKCGPEADNPDRGMKYEVRTRWTMHGLPIEGETVLGYAWYEHQWGGTSWLFDSEVEQSPVLSWEWFGLSLDNGADCLVMVHRDAKTREIVAQHATWFAPDGSTMEIEEVELEARRYWCSPHTFIRYPVEWDIRIPSINLQIHFSPLADDQELATFEPGRAIWEGAGTAEGTIGGIQVAGTARGELHGYGHIFNYDDFLSDATRPVDDALEAFLPVSFTDEQVVRFAGIAIWRHDPAGLTEAIAKPVWDLLKRKGKHWRPLFGLFLLRALGGDCAKYGALVSVMAELIHSGALIIDDIEDDSLLRRGEPCIHLRYGTDIAINAGTALYFLPAIKLMEQTDLTIEQRLQLHEIKERVCIEAHCGQALDIYWTRALTRENLDIWMSEGMEDRLLQMYDLKTGAGTRGVAQVAAVLSGADEEMSAECVKFARAFAVAFQIVDDIHNFSRSPQWTKTAGEDIETGKPTYVIITALRLLDDNRRQLLADLLCDPIARSSAAGRALGIDLVHESGALDLCRKQALRLTDEGWSKLASHLPPTEAKILLRAMCQKMLQFIYES